MRKYFLPFFLSILILSVYGCKDAVEIQEQGLLSVTPASLTFDSTEGSQLIEIRTDAGSWSLAQTENTEWCHPARTSGKTSSSFNISVSGNDGEERSATLTVSAPGCEDVTVTVIQSGEGGFSTFPEEPDADKALTITFKAPGTSALYGYTGDVYIHIGVVDGSWMFVPAGWDENIEKCKMKPDGANSWSIELGPSLREWFGSGEWPVERLGIVIRSADGSLKGLDYDYFLKVKDNKYSLIHESPAEEPVPAGMKHGINYNSDGTVTFVLYEKDRNSRSCYDYSYIIGEFNGWKPSKEYAMKRDEATGCWWYTLSGIEQGKEYMFQYYIGTEENGPVRLSDPYTETVYTGDDHWIPSSTYPDLREYPSETTGTISAFCHTPQEYAWKATDFKIQDKDNLVIYEMHFRDFSTTGDINGAMKHLDYLESLGINTIELMPVQEFDGNDSWGYNPYSYFAMDKAYGTREMYKKFIDECHSRGIAVIIDVVYNHLTGASTLAKLYWDSKNNRTSANNPWFNVEAPHPFSVFHDLDHESQLVREHVKRSLEYLLEEYHIDGFRFDLTKGFTNKKSDESSASAYDASRIAILKDYNDRISKVNPDAVVILEHFCETREEKELGQAGMKVWRNANYAYCQSGMGFSADSGFESLYTGTSMPFGSYTGFMESHDEERVAFKSKAYAGSDIKNSLEKRMRRLELNAAFFFTVPGPKMIWQFGELGYDISIETGGRTGKKPLHWDYYDVPERKAVYDTYARLLGFRFSHPEFFEENASFSWNVGASAWASGRSITCTSGAKSFVMVGNFDTKANDIKVAMPSDGNWRNYFNSSETYTVTGGSITFTDMETTEYKLLVNF